MRSVRQRQRSMRPYSWIDIGQGGHEGLQVIWPSRQGAQSLDCLVAHFGLMVAQASRYG
jgi:hypothetical protein